MADILICPYCRKKLPVRLIWGVGFAWCRYCKREVPVQADKVA